MKTMTEADYRAKAADHLKREQESFDRCDTDGCVSQWCNSLSAREASARADITRDGGRAQFTGLYEGDRRVMAKRVDTRFGTSWLLHDSETALIAKRGKPWLPTGRKSRVLTSLGLAERPEWAPAWATVSGNGRGLSGLASARIVTFRTGDKWGSDAELVVEGGA